VPSKHIWLSLGSSCQLSKPMQNSLNFNRYTFI
jgi:hypothetical protein